STTSLAGPAGPTIYGTDAAFVVTVAPTGGGPTPTGSVTLSEGATTVGAATLDGTGQATITVATLAPGDHALTAHYGGDGANGPSSSAAVTHTVTAAATITSLDVSPAGSSVYGNAVTVTATVSSTDAPLVPGGHVQFFDGPTSIGIAELDPSGTGSWTKLSPAVGTYDLHATYLPAPGFAASGSAHEAHVVAPAATTTDLTASAGTTTFGESMTLTAHVVAVGSPGTPMGSVTFRDGGTVLGTASVDGTGAASLITSDLAVGSRTLVAEYAGTANFDPSMSAGLSHTVVPASVLVAIGDTPDPSVFGTTVTIDVTVTAVAPGTGVPTGTVIVRDGATVVATLPLDVAGTASADISGLAVGPHTLEATYVGDGDFAAGTGSTTHTVVADTATVDLVSSNTNVA
ncbi:MAG: Ig-like domain repeat protein, partial [Acidimicrobiales bacterium]|nr:Ig-like domain repeat protein [Acidimicrobiales bacterium]